MITLRDEITISRTPEDVFAYFADFRNYSAWQNSTEEMVQTSEGPLGVGSTFRVTAKFLPMMKPRFSGRVIEYDPPNKMAMETSGGAPFSATGSYSFEPIEGGTRMTFNGTLTMKGLLKLTEPLMRTSLRKQGEAENRKLKEILESQS